jgi:hypothetical protein
MPDELDRVLFAELIGRIVRLFGDVTDDPRKLEAIAADMESRGLRDANLRRIARKLDELEAPEN